ncbi:hypothetical protein D8B26_000038 [Coccidioides posadasii str. Silveira]|uniref:Uncharacterized protein n=2 Tax=Coccidioides posadasii TaxID=199306 RepID=A0A0J6IGU0_COCPO|nr:hypothetical protein CPC735_067400 [Coccidioides posadasii C735 delta SOWgp]EER25640.1 hypothetical protein CPC735_067400 [Coccidioides posadasii C735 delta SOWgp]KMM71057.1 hypothetical protein CPAG_07364 [Coccidioides posadasii RMSCC 3488]QVM05329.1 hypothetical protein D8B26_000038 [Coccidioides posadasii str. Silveira]|eukprot:XP_003067785.1 hypothetical protein CPC735_067400 [Coccidioides posadasii C735 delta SOWgp]
MKAHTILLCCFAAVCAADLIHIRVRTGKDKEVGLLANMDELERTHRFAASGIGASVTDKHVYCQAFSDPHGRDELGDAFSAANDATFTSSKDAEAVPIGSFYCSDSLDKLEPPGQKPLSLKKSDGKKTDKTVRIQFRTGFDDFTQGDVKLGETVPLGRHSRLGNTVLEAMVVSATGDVNWAKVQCQLYEDTEGKEEVGKAFSMYGETYGTEPEKVAAVRCEA